MNTTFAESSVARLIGNKAHTGAKSSSLLARDDCELILVGIELNPGPVTAEMKQICADNGLFLFYCKLNPKNSKGSIKIFVRNGEFLLRMFMSRDHAKAIRRQHPCGVEIFRQFTTSKHPSNVDWLVSLIYRGLPYIHFLHNTHASRMCDPQTDTRLKTLLVTTVPPAPILVGVELNPGPPTRIVDAGPDWIDIGGTVLSAAGAAASVIGYQYSNAEPPAPPLVGVESNPGPKNKMKQEVQKLKALVSKLNKPNPKQGKRKGQKTRVRQQVNNQLGKVYNGGQRMVEQRVSVPLAVDVTRTGVFFEPYVTRDRIDGAWVLGIRGSHIITTVCESTTPFNIQFGSAGAPLTTRAFISVDPAGIGNAGATVPFSPSTSPLFNFALNFSKFRLNGLTIRYITAIPPGAGSASGDLCIAYVKDPAALTSVASMTGTVLSQFPDNMTMAVWTSKAITVKTPDPDWKYDVTSTTTATAANFAEIRQTSAGIIAINYLDTGFSGSATTLGRLEGDYDFQFRDFGSYNSNGLSFILRRLPEPFRSDEVLLRRLFYLHESVKTEDLFVSRPLSIDTILSDVDTNNEVGYTEQKSPGSEISECLTVVNKDIIQKMVDMSIARRNQ